MASKIKDIEKKFKKWRNEEPKTEIFELLKFYTIELNIDKKTFIIKDKAKTALSKDKEFSLPIEVAPKLYEYLKDLLEEK